jgi:hypothetical protein
VAEGDLVLEAKIMHGSFSPNWISRMDRIVKANRYSFEILHILFILSAMRRAQADEHPRDDDVDLNGARTVLDNRKYGQACLGENLGQALDVLAALHGSKLEP